MKKILPFGNRILVKRRAIGEKLGQGILVASEQTADRLTEIADVVYVPDLTMADNALVENADKIIENLVVIAKEGDPQAYDALQKFNDYLKQKSIRVNDVVFIGKYVGTDFTVGETQQTLTLVEANDIRGMVVESK